MQAALASLAPSSRQPAACAPLAPAALGQLLADALRRAMGIQEPRLIGLLKARMSRWPLHCFAGVRWLGTPGAWLTGRRRGACS